MPRETLYTPELVEIICERLGRGEPLAQICREDGMPAYRTVKDWMDSRDDVSAGIARARESGEDVIGADCLTIADDRSDDPASRRIRVETRLKLLAKWNPKKWGDRTTLAGDPDAPLGGMPESALDAKIAALEARLRQSHEG